ncbi:MAG: transporter associated domain-containing protein [bacterium]|nr:transporter associated domain-containing protein [bacterium]
MTVFCIIWGLFFLFLRRLGIVRVLSLAGCIPSFDSTILDERKFDESKAYYSSRELWFNCIYFVLAISPLFVAVCQPWFESLDLTIICCSILLSYFVFCISLDRWIINKNTGIIHVLIGLYERFSGPFLSLSKLEEGLAIGVLGRDLWGQLNLRLKEYMMRTSLDLAQKQDEQDLDQEEREILRQVDNLFETRIDSIMTPLTRMISISESCSTIEALDNARLHGFSRYPVVSHENNVVGIFRANQLPLLRHLGESVREHMDEVITMVPTCSCYEALEIFQQNKRQFAIVSSEDKSLGILTMEDILEELVGEIEDEFDQSSLRKLSSDTYLVDAVMDLDEFIEYFQLSIPETRSKTVNGFLLEYCGGIPNRGTLISLQGLRILILEADARRISRLRVSKQ